MREAAGDGNCRLGRHRPKLVCQRRELRLSVRALVARAFGQGANALDALEERQPFLAPERFTQQAAEEPHVVAQRFMGVFGHDAIILRSIGSS